MTSLSFDPQPNRRIRLGERRGTFFADDVNPVVNIAGIYLVRRLVSSGIPSRKIVMVGNSLRPFFSTHWTNRKADSHLKCNRNIIRLFLLIKIHQKLKRFFTCLSVSYWTDIGVQPIHRLVQTRSLRHYV